MKKKEAFSLFRVVAENLTSNELGLKTKNPNNESYSDRINEKVKDRISEFHSYLENGMPVAKAKKIILDTTTLVDVQKYIKNYSDEDSLPQNHNCKKELSDILSEVKSLTREIESYKNRMIVIETRIKNLMEDH